MTHIVGVYIIDLPETSIIIITRRDSVGKRKNGRFYPYDPKIKSKRSYLIN